MSENVLRWDTLNMRRQASIIMAVAGALVPNWRQITNNHHADLTITSVQHEYITWNVYHIPAIKQTTVKSLI